MINQVRERYKELEFLKEAIDLSNWVKMRMGHCMGHYINHLFWYKEGKEVLEIYKAGISSYEYLEKLYYEPRTSKYPKGYKTEDCGEEYAEKLWKQVETLVKDNDDVGP